MYVRKEVVGLVPGTAHRVDLWVRTDGVVRWCDLTVSDPGMPSYLPTAASKMCHAAELAESKKRSKWKLLAPAAVTVQPLALESTGLIGPAMREFLRVMEKATTHGPSRRALYVQLSVTCVRFGVEMVREAAGARSIWAP